jgi:hypothetical protein
MSKPAVDKSPKVKAPDGKDASNREPSRVNKELDTQVAIDSPRSSELERQLGCGLVHTDLTLLGGTSVSSGNRTHVPYFRYFGPTAIVPGFKQMVCIPLWIYTA